MWQVLAAAVVVASIAIALLLAWGTAQNGHSLGVEWAGLLGVVFGAVLGVPEVVARRAENRRADAAASTGGAADELPQP